MVLQIRKLTKSDYTAIKEIFIESNSLHTRIDPMFATKSDADQIWINFVDSIAQQRDYKIYIAILDRVIVGFCIGQIIEKPPIFQERLVGNIDIIAVKKGYKRQGIGTKLFDSICTWFKTYQVSHVELTAASKNPQSIGFWNKMGGKEFMKRMSIKL